MAGNKLIGFPDLDYGTDFQETRPLTDNELPRLALIDHQMNIIEAHYERIAKTIKTFWGHRGCVEYLQQLILNGGDGIDRTRAGFKHEVTVAIMKLIELHEIQVR